MREFAEGFDTDRSHVDDQGNAWSLPGVLLPDEVTFESGANYLLGTFDLCTAAKAGRRSP